MPSTSAATPAATGFDLQASIRRIVDTYRREAVDRVPIMSPIAWNPTGDIDSEEFDDWRDTEDFRRVARLVQQHCDVRPTHNAVKYPGVWAGTSYQRFLEASAEHIEELPPEQLSAVRKRHTSVLHTPKGDLRWCFDEDDGVFTRWDREKPIKSPADVEAMLSVPYQFTPPDPADYEPFRSKRAAAGDYAIGGSGINSMVAMLCGMIDYQLFLEWTITEPGLLKLLADEWLKRVGEKVAWLQSQGVGPFWHFNGVERAAPPMMSPAQWNQWVVPYDGEIMRRIKAADPQAKIHVHCHGKVRALLDSFVEMGVDSTDPVEPLPQGDVDIAEIKKTYAGQLIFYGSIQFADMETASADQVEEIVRRTLTDSGRQDVILMSTSGPHQQPLPDFYDNAQRYIEAGLKYGQM
jgi:Uroporphyrinogen decarboxylase (URO-D)